jgi:hypothetical protein
MIFNINEIANKLKRVTKAKRPQPKRKGGKPRIHLTVRDQLSPAKDRHRIFKIYKTGEKQKTVAKILVGKQKLDKESKKILLALLYWSSGSKYPASNFVAFSNSDYNLVKTFLNLLRSAFPIKESKIKVHLQLYASHNAKEMIRFWSKLLKIPRAQFYNPRITKPKRMRQRNYFGTCTVRYYNLSLLQTIMGTYQKLADLLANK